MKKELTLLALLWIITGFIISCLAQSVPDYIRTKKVYDQSVVDARLKASLSLSVPYGPAYTLNGAKDSIGYVFFNTTTQKVGVYIGLGIWRELSDLSGANYTGTVIAPTFQGNLSTQYLTGTSLPVGIVYSGITTVGALAGGSLTTGFTPVSDALIASSSVWNAKQAALSGTGLLSFSGTIPSYNTTSASIANIITDETGTGSLVYSTNPVLNTSFSLSTSASRILKFSEATVAVPSVRSVNETGIGLRGMALDGNNIYLRTGSPGGLSVMDALIIDTAQNTTLMGNLSGKSANFFTALSGNAGLVSTNTSTTGYGGYLRGGNATNYSLYVTDYNATTAIIDANSSNIKLGVPLKGKVAEFSEGNVSDGKLLFKSASPTLMQPEILGLSESSTSGVYFASSPALSVNNVNFTDAFYFTAYKDNAGTLPMTAGNLFNITNNNASKLRVDYIGNTFLAGDISIPSATLRSLPSTSAGSYDILTRNSTTGVVEKQGVTGSGLIVQSGSPSLTGIPTAPTAPYGTNTTQVATTEYVKTHSTGGTYTPVITFPANVTSATPYISTYTVVGDIVTVYGHVDVVTNASGTPTNFGISLPVPSDFTSVNDLNGNINEKNFGISDTALEADAVNNRANLIINLATNTYRMYYNFQYIIKSVIV